MGLLLSGVNASPPPLVGGSAFAIFKKHQLFLSAVFETHKKDQLKKLGGEIFVLFYVFSKKQKHL
jgi:hypothetical protein